MHTVFDNNYTTKREKNVLVKWQGATEAAAFYLFTNIFIEVCYSLLFSLGEGGSFVSASWHFDSLCTCCWPPTRYIQQQQQRTAEGKETGERAVWKGFFGNDYRGV